MNLRTNRFVDANPRDLQDNMPSTGVYRVLVPGTRVLGGVAAGVVLEAADRKRTGR